MPSLIYRDTMSASIWYASDGEALQHLLPQGYTLGSAQIMVSVVMNRGVEWMGGEPYNIVSVNVPATFSGKQDQVSGWYSLVVWENNAIPILPGREGTGIPKIYGEVEDFRFMGSEMRTWAHLAGHTFCNLHFTELAEATTEERAFIDSAFARMEWMAWRYIPRTGPSGGAELSQATLFPQEFISKRVRLGKATIEWSIPPLWQNPTQQHIIASLANLPVGEPMGPAVIMEAENILRADQARVLR
jgi:hypothetical protein